MTSYLQTRALYPPLIIHQPSPKLGIIVVIPVYAEKQLLASLYSLKNCTPPESDIEIIILINDSAKDNISIKELNEKTYETTKKWIENNKTSRLKYHVLHKKDLPKKHAGAGLARKIGMDEACWRFAKAGVDDGIILCFDADSTVETGYFIEVERFFQNNPKIQAAGIYFEHPVSGYDFDEKIFEAIIQYELHLRYFINAQKQAGFPFAYQTIGSAMAVRANAYQQQGGMNKRQAGEDFYFLHKFIQIGKFDEIKTTKVIPSPRPSFRVPFGTGKAVEDILKSKKEYLTYNPMSFTDLSHFSKTINRLFGLEEKDIENYLSHLPESIRKFLIMNNFHNKLKEIKSHTTNPATFENRFFKWFNAFLLMKYLHFARDNYYPDVSVKIASRWLLQKLTSADFSNTGNKEMLEFFRKIDRI